MKSLLVLFVFIFISIPCYADVHKFKGSDGSTLLTNRQPTIHSGVALSNATTHDLQPNSKSQIDNQINYSYEGTKKYIPTKEIVKVGTRDVYKQGLCKINNSIVPCYNYEKTLPATSFQVDSSKSIEVSPDEVLQESIKSLSK